MQSSPTAHEVNSAPGPPSEHEPPPESTHVFVHLTNIPGGKAGWGARGRGGGASGGGGERNGRGPQSVQSAMGHELYSDPGPPSALGRTRARHPRQ